MRIIKLLILTSIILMMAGCNMFFDPVNKGLNDNNITDNGNLYQVKINFGGNARTILPTLTGNLYGGFSKFIINAESANGSQQSPSPIEITSMDDFEYGHFNQNNSPDYDYDGYVIFNLPQGEWIFTVTAFVNVEGADYPAVNGSTKVYVSENRSVIINILTPIPEGTGTFNYKVSYPDSGSAVLKLVSLNGGGTVIDNVSVSSGIEGSQDVSSGFYFLTIAATANGKTVTRSEIVHIYPHSATNANYVFTKIDFGLAYSINISGTIKLLVDGVQPDEGYIYFCTRLNEGYVSTQINFTGSDGNGTWEFDLDDTGTDNVIYMRAGLNYHAAVDLSNLSIPVDDITGIDLGTVEINTIPITENSWVNGEITSNNPVVYYSIDLIANTTYYFWNNSRWNGDYTKTLNNIHVGSTNLYMNQAWDNPVSFIPDNTGKYYIAVSSNTNETGTYAITYSANPFWHNNSFSPNAVAADPDTWIDGIIEKQRGSNWYSISVTAGETYYIWFNNFYGDGSKNLEGSISIRNNGGAYINGMSDAWNHPLSFIPNYTGTAYIHIESWDEPGDYAFAYSTDIDFNNLRTDFTVSNTTDWENALESIRNGNDGTSDVPELYTITVNGNISVPGFAEANLTFGTAQYIEVTLIGNGKLTLNSAGSIINLGGNQTLIIDSSNLILEGFAPNTAAVIEVTGATLELKAGTITNNDSSGASAGGVGVSQNGIFTMSGGTISNNKGHFGGGVASNGGTINMSDGTINGNEAVNGSGGGVYVGRFTVFNMSGGTISGNSTNRSGGGVGLVGITFNDGEWYGAINKTGGTIYGNDGSANSNSAAHTGHAISYLPYFRDATSNTTDNINNDAVPAIPNAVDPDSPVLTGHGWTTNRWLMNYSLPNNATLDHFSVNNETGVVTTTVSGETGGTAWRIRPRYYFNAETGKRYEYKFEAWLDSGTRNLYLLYYENNDTSTYLGQGVDLTTTPQTFTVIGDVIPRDGFRHLQFQCGDQLGTFYLKMISITEYTE